MSLNAWRLPASILLMMASGFAGLGYQIVWTQQSALWLGHESAAVLAVITAFFGGLALGSLVLGVRVEASSRPLRWYACCEAIIAVWGFLLIFLMPHFGGGLAKIIGLQPPPLWHWSVSFFGVFVILLPATLAMGTTLPAMERLAKDLVKDGGVIAILYASNTLGAVLGVLAAAFWLVPTLGLARTALVCVVLNVVSAGLSLLVFRAQSVSTVTSTTADAGPHARRRLLICLFLTGLLGIAYEVVVVRVLSEVSENTVYTFALLLAVYLIGTSVGAFAYQRWGVRNAKANELANALLCMLGAACLVGIASLWKAEGWKTLGPPSFGDSVITAVLAESVPAVFAFGPPTFIMGALFSHLARQAKASGIGFGRALAINTLGAATAPVLFGVIVYPVAGPKLALLLIVSGYLALVSSRIASYLRALSVVLGAATVAVLLFAPPLAFVDLPKGGELVSYMDGAMAAVSVVKDADGVLRLRINNRQQEGSSATFRVDGRQAWLPLLLHPSPKSALFLGLGTGITASSAALDTSLTVDAVELLPEVVAASKLFTGTFANGVATTRLNVISADARRFVRASKGQYDVIVSDNFHPARSGSGSLYTVEHFQAVRNRLAPLGVFCQWLPLHQMDLATLRSIVRSFMVVYPSGAALIASNSLETPVLGLIGRPNTERFEPSAIRRRLADRSLPEQLVQLGFEDEFAVLGTFVAGPESLRVFASNSPANTDDQPVVIYRAPFHTYVPESNPRQRLITLLHELSLQVDSMISANVERGWSERLAKYWLARNRFVELGKDVRPSSSVKDMLFQVQAPLLSVLRISPDFRPAYDPLLSMADALSRVDVSAARTLLTELATVQPQRAEASQLLSTLNETANLIDPAAR